jgi:hypothetical protein
VASVGELETVESKRSLLEGWRFVCVRGKVLSILRSCWWWWRQVSGDAAYENYVRCAMRGPGKHAAGESCNVGKIASAEQFYLDRLRRENARINRCC